MTEFLKYRKYFIYLSQISGIFICIFFIIQYQQYEMSWQWQWLLPQSIIDMINQGLSKTGTLCLIIPLSISITALMIPESMLLRMISSFMGVASTLTVIMSGYFSNQLLEVYNMRMFLITKIFSLEEKKVIFFKQINILIEHYNKQELELYLYLKKHTLSDMYSIYEIKLDILKQSDTIKAYAYDIIQQLVTQYKQEKQAIILNNFNHYAPYFLYVGLGLIGILTVTTVLKYIFFNDTMTTGFSLVKDGALLSSGIVERLTNSITQVKSMIEQIQILMVSYATKAELTNSQQALVNTLKDTIKTEIQDKTCLKDVFIEITDNILKELMTQKRVIVKILDHLGLK